MCASGSRESRPVPSRARPRQRAVRPPATFSRQLLQSFRRDLVGSRAVPRLLSAVNTESSLARPSNRNCGTVISPTITTPQRRLVTPGFMQFHFGAPVARGSPPFLLPAKSRIAVKHGVHAQSCRWTDGSLFDSTKCQRATLPEDHRRGLVGIGRTGRLKFLGMQHTSRSIKSQLDGDTGRSVSTLSRGPFPFL